MNYNMIKNKGTGRREIKPIKATSNSRHVTFSKRRVGLFKKASELCALTGAECAILCESFGGRVFAFGHPSVESVVDKYLGENINSVTDVNSPCMHDKLKQQYLDITKEIEIERNKSVNNSDSMERGELFWWEQPFEHLGLEELEEYVSSMEELMSRLKLRADDLMLIKSWNNSNAGFVSDMSLVTEDLDGQPNELVANSNLNFSDDGFLNVLLAMKDDELQDFFNDLELRDNNALVPNVNVVPDDYRRAADLPSFDAAGVLPNEFTF